MQGGSVDPFKRLICQHWALNLIRVATDSQWRVWREGGDTGEFAEVEGSLQYSGGVMQGLKGVL